MGHSDKPEGSGGPSKQAAARAGRPEAPAAPPSLDLLEDPHGDTIQTEDRPGSGAAPLDPGAFDGARARSKRRRADRTLRIDLATPAGLPRIEPRPPPLPATKPARPLRPQDGSAPPPLPVVHETPAPVLLRTPISNPVIEMVGDDVIFDIDVTGVDQAAYTADPSLAEGAVAERSAPAASGSRSRDIVGLPLPAPLPVGVSTRDIAARPAAPEPAPPTVNLPCSVLVVDDDRRAGAQIAARLMEVGYTCRVTNIDSVQAVLAQQGFDVALIDVPAEELRRDEGHGRIGRIAPWSGPIVLTGPVLPSGPHALPAQVRAVLSKPLLPAELIRTLEAARADSTTEDVDPDGPDFSTFEAMPDETDTSPLDDPPPEDDHPNDARHEIPDGVRAMVSLSDGRTVRGTVIRASYGGRLILDLREAIRSAASVDVEVILLDRRRSEIPGRFVATSAGVEISLDLDPGDVVHFRRFLDEARDPSLPGAEALRIKERPPIDAHSSNLDQLWLTAQEQLDDDAVQQAFIQACLSQQRMDFAIRCYRRLKEAYPEDERVAKYLKQVGTILGFYALRKEQGQDEAAPNMSAGLKIAFGLFLLAALIFMALALFLG